MFGSSGGGGKNLGGGALYMNSTSLKLDGAIKVDGQSAKEGSTVGGASGGSLLVDTGSFAGAGVIQANGGNGGSAGGGGGSGGRISILSTSSFYTGSVTAYGGSSPVEAGAAGTIYKKDKTTGKTILEIYNLGRRPASTRITTYRSLSSDSARTWLTKTSLKRNPSILGVDYAVLSEDLYEGFSFDELRLGGGAHLAFEMDPHHLRMIEVKKLIGDYEGDSFGFIHAGPKQLLVIKETDYYIPVNLNVYELGFAHLQDRIMLRRNSLSLQGYLFGVRDLTISDCLVELGSNSSALTTGKPKALHFDINAIKILDKGILQMVDTTEEYILKTKSLEINPGGSLVGRNVTLISNFLVVHESSQVSLEGQGVRCVPVDAYFAGSGGSHSGYGGLGKAAQNRQEPFDSIHTPTFFGGAGRAGRVSPSCHGGYGGGRLNVTVGGVLRLDGVISSR